VPPRGGGGAAPPWWTVTEQSNGTWVQQSLPGFWDLLRNTGQAANAAGSDNAGSYVQGRLPGFKEGPAQQAKSRSSRGRPQGRTADQTRLRQLAKDPKLSSSLRGWIKQELNQIRRGTRSWIRRPPGYELAHWRGYEASKGYNYLYSSLNTIELHDIQTFYQRSR
jgi:hypothetical protein